MQTRRDLLHAYRFQNRRALAALVTGEPNVLEPPMRRLTVVTISGIMIAILIACGFALLGIFKPTTGDKWKDAGAIIVERETGARYVYLQGVLHPVLNYSSAVLAVLGNQDPHVVLVDRGDLSGAKRGATIGIDGIPDSLPSSSNLLRSPWTVCSREEGGATEQLDARVSVVVGGAAGARTIPASQAVVVRAVTGGERYLLYGGQRLALGSDAVGTALGLQSGSDVPVGTAFLDGIPAGPALKAPDIADAGSPGPELDGKPTVIGQLLFASDTRKYYLALSDGAAQLNDMQTALLRTLPIGPDNGPLPTRTTTASAVLAMGSSQREWSVVAGQFKGLPATVPSADPVPAQRGGVCAVYRSGAAQPSFAVPASRLPSFPTTQVVESPRSQQGRADEVVLSPGRAAVARSSNRSATVFVIADPGEKFAVTSASVLAGFGYDSVKPALVPAELLPLIPTGPALDPTAARRPASG